MDTDIVLVLILLLCLWFWNSVYSERIIFVLLRTHYVKFITRVNKDIVSGISFAYFICQTVDHIWFLYDISSLQILSSEFYFHGVYLFNINNPLHDYN